MPTIVQDAFYVVLRDRLEAAGLVRTRGEVLDTTGWRNVKPLVENRYLGAVPHTLEECVQCPCGRRWVDETAATKHECPARIPAQKRRAKTSATV